MGDEQLAGGVDLADERPARRPSATARSAGTPCAPRRPRRRCRARRGRSGSRRPSTEQTSKRRHPGSSRTDASAFAAMPARNSSRRSGRTSIWTIRLNIAVLRFRRVVVCDTVYNNENNMDEGRHGRRHGSRRTRCGTFGTRVLAALGVPEDDGALVADSLVQADLWGHQSHGFLRLPWYAARIRSRRHARGHRPRGAVRHRPAPAARRPRRHRPGAHRARPRGWRSSGPGPTASASSACATPTTSARRCTSPAAPPTTAASPSSPPTRARRWPPGAAGRSGSAPTRGRSPPRARRPGRRRRHRQHRGGPGQDLPGEEPRRADPRDLGARPRTARRRPTRRRGCSA